MDSLLALKNRDRVVFIGYALLERMQEHGWLEAMMLQRFSTDDLVRRTLAWSADEVNLILPDAFEKMDFLPKSPNVLRTTTMILENKSDTLRFHAPMEPGKYPCVCSFPGHYLVRRGVMVVE